MYKNVIFDGRGKSGLTSLFTCTYLDQLFAYLILSSEERNWERVLCVLGVFLSKKWLHGGYFRILYDFNKLEKRVKIPKFDP